MEVDNVLSAKVLGAIAFIGDASIVQISDLIERIDAARPTEQQVLCVLREMWANGLIAVTGGDKAIWSIAKGF